MSAQQPISASTSEIIEILPKHIRGFFFPKITNNLQDIITYFFPLSMVAWMIDEFGSEELRERFVPELASMQVKWEIFFLNFLDNLVFLLLPCVRGLIFFVVVINK